MNPVRANSMGGGVFPASRKETTDADRVEKHKALRAHSSGGVYANGAVMPPTSATLRSLNAPQCPHKAHIDREEFYVEQLTRRYSRPNRLLLTAIGLACTLGR